jgi:hypothetical protein
MLDKEQVKFEHPATGMDICRQCVHFLKEKNRCEIVSGSVQPEDWCDRFKKRVSKFAHAHLPQKK